MPRTVPPQLESIAAEIGIDTSDLDEPMTDLIDRVRLEVQEAKSEAETQFQDWLAELDAIEAEHVDDDDDEPAHDVSGTDNTKKEKGI